MKTVLLKPLAWLALSTVVLLAQNVSGTWQGTLTITQGRELRIVAKITRADDESLKAIFYSIDQGGAPINASAVSMKGSTLKFTLAAIGGDYDGKLSADGNTLSGTWTQGPAPIPLNLTRATKGNEWTIPEPPPPPKIMPADAKPTFDVATIKPSRPDAQGQSILVGRGGTNLFTTTNVPLNVLIVFAYGLHPKQLTGGPSWMDSEKYDISAKPDREGVPNVDQLKKMVQELIVERFGFKFHLEKKELSVYAITVAKSGVKMTKVDGDRGNLPGYGGPPGNLQVRNTTMEDFAGFLQNRIVDRPVVDQTGLKDRYDFRVRYTPDRAVPAAAGANAPVGAAGDVDAPPDLYAAFQQQLGLKLESTKAAVSVMVIDQVAKPSEN